MTSPSSASAVTLEARVVELEAALAAKDSQLTEMVISSVVGTRRAEASEASATALLEVLERIGRWFGEFPPSDAAWPDGTPMSYGAAYGSNGERDYMREVANAAIREYGASNDRK